MSNIVTKLNLNRTPAIVDNNSMVFAKNIRIDIDGTIHKDYSINPMSIQLKSDEDCAVYYENIFNRIVSDYATIIKNSADTTLVDCATHFYEKLAISDAIYNFYIIDVIANSNEFYLFTYTTWKDDELDGSQYMIVRYDEAEDLFYPCNCNWTYSGGTITGCVINNLLGEKILNIGEHGAVSNSVPLKCINLSKSKYTDNESVYTQSPNIPITNLEYAGTFAYSIPNGVYQFFIRYKIREEFYTNWFPASRELYIGNKTTTATIYGTLGFVNTHLDSNKSFILNVNHLYPEYKNNYESFQIGFILSHDDAIYARGWKHFGFAQNVIKFDYIASDADEIEVTDLTKATYQLYNVGNITSFKNKLYISNYTETDFNNDLQDYANDIKIDLVETLSKSGYADYAIETTDIGAKSYITAFKDKDGTKTNITGLNGIIYQMLNDTPSSGHSIKNLIKDSLNTGQTVDVSSSSTKFDLYLFAYRNTLYSSTLQAEDIYKKTYGDSFYNIDCDLNVNYIKIANTTIWSTNSEDDATDLIISKISNMIRYLDENANFCDANTDIISSFEISIYRKAIVKYWSYSPSKTEIEPYSRSADKEPMPGEKVLREIVIYYPQIITINLKGYKSKLTTGNTDDIINYTTLIPYQKYKFYIHFVKNTGEISNGYYCGGTNAGVISAPYKETCSTIIYPKFSNIKVPSGYSACFFSILHYSLNTSTIINVDAARNSNGDIIAYEGSCIDLNTRLAPVASKLQIQQNDNIITGNYYYSSDATIIRYFGANGVISIDKNEIPENNETLTIKKNLYVVSDYDSVQEKDATLIKCTPYIKSYVKLDSTTGHQIPISTQAVEFDSYTDLNLLGFVCQVYDINRLRAIEYYSDGSNVYHKDNTYTIKESVNIQFTELGKYTDDTYRISAVGLITTNKVNVYSNYNFNYLALNEEPKQVVKTYYPHASTETPSKVVSCSVLWRLLTSLTLSEVYTLPSMYKSFTRRTFIPYNTDEIIYYNNTIRSSLLQGDEAKISIFKFDAEDYYNVPTNRGIIVNLINIGDSILVHTKDSIFKFTGSNSLQSSSGEIQPAETEVFNTGVSEIFGSDFGFAGLQYKTDCIVTENGYIFFDRDSLIVYMYSGNGQITKISDSIEKLFRHGTISNVYFANDYYNNRFFMSIWFLDSDTDTYAPVTLSFYINETVKAFVSLHDFAFTKAFNTKSKCYFINKANNNISVIDKSRYGEYYGLEFTDITYPSKNENRLRTVKPYNSKMAVRLKIPIFYSIIDVIENAGYENIKTLNSLSWCSRYITKEFPTVITDNVYNMADSKEGVYPCDILKIYTDTCATKDLDLTDIANASSILNPNSYMYPRYNQGYWSMNYFRNIENANNLFKYLGDPVGTNPTYTDSRDVAGVTPEYRSDENSLIEGKYFVARFIFNSEYDFKLETINFNYNIKL